MICVVLVLVCLLGGPCGAHTFYVTNTRDDYDEGSFRWAVGMCDWYPILPDTVLFAIPMTDPGYDPETGVWTIAYDLAATSGDPYAFWKPHAVVDGFSQREFIGHDTNPYGPEIELKGPYQQGVPNRMGVVIYADDITIRGLCINGFGSDNVSIYNKSDGSLSEHITITGCYIGCDPTGSRAEAHSPCGIDARGVTDLRIGGDAPEDRNILSGSGIGELAISYAGSFEVVNNIIGLDRTGTVDLTSGSGAHQQFFLADISYDPGSGDRGIVRGNTIAGRKTLNVWITHVAVDTGAIVFRDNLIGVGLNGGDRGPRRTNLHIKGSGLRFEGNVVAYAHAWYGFKIWDETSDFNTITRNSVYGCNRLGIQLSNWPATLSEVDFIDGVYGPGVNEEIDPCYCDSVVQGAGETVAYMTCMRDCAVEIFIGDSPGSHYECSLAAHGDVYSGRTYVGDAEEIAPGPVFSQYRLAISPPLPPGTVLTSTATNRNGSTSEFGCSCAVPMAGEAEAGCRPPAFKLLRPAPNPFCDRTILCYHVPKARGVSISAYDVAGRCVATIAGGHHEPGAYGLAWEGADDHGALLPGGTYMIRMVADGFACTHPVSILR
ncbi:hypothetical protein JXA88_09355 [Candidatus Fermentibacteria bacterium]|nr:hypothetical protein [Candidatus Fermentibacteria bacterium]